MKLSGKVALITGGSRGIGKGIALAYAREGSDIAINYASDDQAAQETIQEIQKLGRKAVALKGDVSKFDQASQLIDQTAKDLGRLDILVNNAGICWFMPFLEVTPEVWERTIGVDLTGTLYCSQFAAKQMIKQGEGGRIINITSIGAQRSNAKQTHYCAAKGGQELLTKGMAIELAPHGITVNNLAPGTIATDINKDFFDDPNNYERYVEGMIPMRRLGTPQDCAGAAVFFASQESNYVTGATLLVDGGHNAKL